MSDAIGSQNLLSIYGVYEKLKGKSTASTSGASSAAEGRPATPTATKAGPSTGAAPSSTPASTTPESESLKSQGNAAMAKKDYAKAVELYSKAIDIAPANPIYLSNRAAAYSAEHKHHEAVADAEMAVAADPKYTKAWSRLGLARFVLGDARGSMEAYEKGIEAEGKGGSEAMKKGYRTAKDKVDEQEREGQAGGMAEDVDDAPGSTRAGAAPGGMPDLSALAGMMGGGGAGGGGMPDMASIMSNPMFASMAQNLMQNPQALQGLMNNPQLRGMADRFGLGGMGGGAGAGAGAGAGEGAEAGAGAGADAGAGTGRGAAGGGGGMPDLASLMQDPSIAEM